MKTTGGALQFLVGPHLYTARCGRVGWARLFYCTECADQITQLDRMGGEHTAAAQLIIERFRRAAKRVNRWLWVPQLLFIGGVLLFLGWRAAQAFLEWIAAGGMH